MAALTTPPLTPAAPAPGTSGWRQSRSRARVARTLRVGTQITTMSPGSSCPSASRSSANTRSTTPVSRARSRVSGRRETPITSRQRRRSRAALARLPPIRPSPYTSRRPKAGPLPGVLSKSGETVAVNAVIPQSQHRPGIGPEQLEVGHPGLQRLEGGHHPGIAVVALEVDEEQVRPFARRGGAGFEPRHVHIVGPQRLENVVQGAGL